ncbi:MAG: 4-(cytidine 5'-diphospho)-2-C-methyl-D-erythritol kinase [Acidimicrobiales bacterium]
MRRDGLVELAPAKLTRRLAIVGTRPGDGYHLIDAEMVSVSLVDVVEITSLGGRLPTGNAGVEAAERVEVIDRTGLATGVGVPAGGSNLVMRALAAAGRRAAIKLTKTVPPGAGLGGGSSDAAAVLRWAGISDLAVAAAVGSDVAFCLSGGRARVTGAGEQVAPLTHLDLDFTLMLSPMMVPTSRVYAAFDRGDGRGGLRNDLEAAALVVEPRLEEARQHLWRATGQRPMLAGSGSTWFVEGAHPGAEGAVTMSFGTGRVVVVRSLPAATCRPGAASGWL